jgi:sarcosine oxidase subunit beta
VQTTRGRIATGRLGLAVAGASSRLAALAGLRLPLETLTLQAFVSEPLKPMLDVIVSCPALGIYFSQSDKGELVIGGGPDAGLSWTQRGQHHVIEDCVAGLLELFPALARVKLLRTWGGAIDLSADTSPILSHTEVQGLCVSTGWGSGGRSRRTSPGGWHRPRRAANRQIVSRWVRCSARVAGAAVSDASHRETAASVKSTSVGSWPRCLA